MAEISEKSRQTAWHSHLLTTSQHISYIPPPHRRQSKHA